MFSNTTSDSPLKAIDFGLADYCSKGDILWERCGTPLYIAPEVLRRKYGQESDLWSAGVVAYQVGYSITHIDCFDETKKGTFT